MTRMVPPNISTQNLTERVPVFHKIPEVLLELLPCVLYECSASLNLTYLSPNVHQMIGIPAHKLLGSRVLWEERILPEDLASLREKIRRLETVEKAVDLTRTFSDYAQSPTWFSEINFLEIINAAAVSRRASFAEKGIILDQKVHESVRGVTMSGDPYLLELALGSILENAFEASQSGGTVVLKAMAEISDSRTSSAVRLSVVDSGSGIETNNLENI